MDKEVFELKYEHGLLRVICEPFHIPELSDPYILRAHSRNFAWFHKYYNETRKMGVELLVVARLWIAGDLEEHQNPHEWQVIKDFPRAKVVDPTTSGRILTGWDRMILVDAANADISSRVTKGEVSIESLHLALPVTNIKKENR